MRQELEDQLVGKYPKIFSQIRSFQHGDGWLHIIDALCACIQNECDHNIKDLKRINPEVTEEELEDLQVRAVQVKEKFGGLRFYIGSGNTEIFGMIRMAEEISFKICEECGSPGKNRGGGWIKTLCDPCVIASGRKDEGAEDEGC